MNRQPKRGAFRMNAWQIPQHPAIAMPAEHILAESSLETALEGHALVLFDGVCNLCNSSVNFIIDRDPAGYFKFAALQDETVASLLARFDLSTDYLDSVVLLEEGRCYRESTAALRIARRLRGGWPLFYAFIVVPRPVRDVVYGWIARNRYRWFGKRDTCRIPTPELRERFL
jgi:predicted DCC family thiol-disulfide oxidoreductase YuxK